MPENLTTGDLVITSRLSETSLVSKSEQTREGKVPLVSEEYNFPGGREADYR